MKITVVLPCYNGAKYIADQINSILYSLNDFDELIVADDNSSDETVAIVEAFADKRLKLIRRQKNIGLLPSINELIDLASGDYIAFSDQDDVWMENRLSAVRQLQTAYDIIVSDCIVTNENLECINPSYFNLIGFNLKWTSNLFRCRFLGSSMVISKSFANELFPLSLSLPAHDWAISMGGLIKKKNIKVIETPLIMYRRHSGSVSSLLNGRKRSIYDRLSDRFIMLAFCFRNFQVKHEE